MVDFESIDKELDGIYYAVGVLIVSWSGIENYLFMVLASAVQPKDPLALSAAYHSQVNFSNKLEMVDQASQCAFDEKTLRKWRRFYDRLNDNSQIRNRVAHFMAINDIRVIKEKQRNYIYLRPAVYNMAVAMKDKRSKKKKNMTKYSLKDLNKLTKQFKDLFDDLSLFANSLPKPSGRIPAYF